MLKEKIQHTSTNTCFLTLQPSCFCSMQECYRSDTHMTRVLPQAGSGGSG